MEEKILIEATSKLMEQARETKFKEQQRKKEREQRMTETPAVQPSVPDTPTNEPQATDTTPDLNNSTPLPPEPTPANTYTSYIPAEGNEQKVFYAKEEDLVRMLIRYGEKTMCYIENNEGEQVPYTVIECIATGLKEDEQN